jgi:RNA polymerase sigma-70 factor, ECF subfamily
MFDNQELTVEAPRLKKFALRLTGNQHDADDLVQATLLRAMEKADLFQTGSDLWKWLSKMMYNLFVTNYRRTVRWQCQFDPQEVIDRSAEDGDQERKMELKMVGRVIEQLPAKRREILLLICVQGLSYEEVAEKLDIPVGTVRSRLSRARSQLQDLLKGRQEIVATSRNASGSKKARKTRPAKDARLSTPNSLYA